MRRPGAAEIENGLTSIFQRRGKTARLRSLNVSVRFLRPDVALAYVTNEMSGLVSGNGHWRPSHRELSIGVLVEDAGVWKIAAFHNTILPQWRRSRVVYGVGMAYRRHRQYCLTRSVRRASDFVQTAQC